jgi:uncharacterized protein YndB with AHSA1/START domain
MLKKQYEIQINAPREKVWKTMLEDATYREWTMPFGEGVSNTSYFEGGWSKGSQMKFLASPGNGMIAQIVEHIPGEFISIQHLGMIENGVIDTESDAVKAWTPAFENYTLTEVDGGTKVTVDIDVHETYAEMFDDKWPKALQLVKEIAER